MTTPVLPAGTLGEGPIAMTHIATRDGTRIFHLSAARRLGDVTDRLHNSGEGSRFA
jgi:hypothetical protein